MNDNSIYEYDLDCLKSKQGKEDYFTNVLTLLLCLKFVYS